MSTAKPKPKSQAKPLATDFLLPQDLGEVLDSHAAGRKDAKDEHELIKDLAQHQNSTYSTISLELLL